MRPYTLNYNKSRVLNYIDKVTLWTDGTCAAKYPDFSSHMPVQNYSTTITDYFSYCGWWKYWCKTAVSCIPSDYITLQRYFSRKIEHISVTLSVGPYLLAPY
jgi:hypothetical protein